jgi:Xaa-Pro aminopeptidase
MNQDFFVGNRRRLCEQLQPGSFVVLTGFTSMQGDNDQAAPFVQESNFWYLTGIEEPDWRLLIDVDSGEEWLVAPQRSFARQMFDGGIANDDAVRISGCQNVIDAREGRGMLQKLLASKKLAYTVLPLNLRHYGIVPNPAQRRLTARLRSVKVTDLRLILARQRAIKQPAELVVMQKAIDITLDGFEAVLPKLRGMHYEYEVDAELTASFRRRGATHGFPPIIGAGRNACVLHHPLPKDPLVPGSWLLMDIGAKIDGYSADITRTIPIGNPNARHVEIYEAVQRMHDFVFSQMKHGAPADEFMKKSYLYVGKELKKIGLISTIKLDDTSVFKFMPHAVSHGLGVDVHDSLGRPETLQENMVMTVEVGAYNLDEGIGVRLEDDVRITKTGAINMSKRVPIALDALSKML